MVSRLVSVTDLFEIVFIFDVIWKSICGVFWVNCGMEMEFGKSVEKVIWKRLAGHEWQILH